uniref:Uncharacterized protein n=1 Tax=Spongospora subterranea TaxID=70186 RepID=A0A0H5QHA6_9EUKA|eukprot:CRZ01385.1 hypothetical protein [Spongospora subterranea]
MMTGVKSDYTVILCVVLCITLLAAGDIINTITVIRRKHHGVSPSLAPCFLRWSFFHEAISLIINTVMVSTPARNVVNDNLKVGVSRNQSKSSQRFFFLGFLRLGITCQKLKKGLFMELEIVK